MSNYSEIFFSTFTKYSGYIWSEITFQTETWYVNYFWWLIIISAVIWGLEILFPWRKKQPIFRKDFWLDCFYMFFNFLIFKIVIFASFSALVTAGFENIVGHPSELALLDANKMSFWLQIIVFFVSLDFIQWIVHYCFHRFNFLWQFHKVHHSVQEMGFAAHFRYHWMENVIYTPAKYLMVLLIGGFDHSSVFIIYYINIAIGHLNHANVNLNYGPLKFILNNPAMHIWHHSYSLPNNKKHGVNFGISLSVWDYIFRTNYIPKSGRDIKIGFKKLDQFPKTFIGQLVYPMFRKK